MFDRDVFRTRLRELRKQAGESQAQLAKVIGVSTNQVSEMEKGTKTTTFTGQKVFPISGTRNVYRVGMALER